MTTRTMFLEELAKTLDYWSRETTSAMVDPTSDLTWADKPSDFRALQAAIAREGLLREVVQAALSESFRGFATSFLTIIDGGTELAEHAQLRLIDESGESLGEGLHDEFISHLLETGRMK